MVFYYPLLKYIYNTTKQFFPWGALPRGGRPYLIFNNNNKFSKLYKAMILKELAASPNLQFDFHNAIISENERFLWITSNKIYVHVGDH
jgi:hypothetical protein